MSNHLSCAAVGVELPLDFMLSILLLYSPWNGSELSRSSFGGNKLDNHSTPVFDSNVAVVAPKTRKIRKFWICKKPDHNSATCPDKEDDKELKSQPTKRKASGGSDKKR